MSTVSSALFHAYEKADMVERAFAETEGEVTEETEAAEALAELANADALQAFAGFLRHCELGLENVAAEVERLEAATARIKKAEAWARSNLLGLLGDRKKATAGTFKISTRRGNERVEVDEGFSLDTDKSPARWTDGTAGKWTLDKKAALKALKSGTKIEGLSVTRGPTTLKVS